MGHLVRANTGVERGLENIGTYDCTIFTTRGISHLDNPVLDTGGAVPSAADVRRVLQSCEAPLQSSKAVDIPVYHGSLCLLSSCRLGS